MFLIFTVILPAECETYSYTIVYFYIPRHIQKYKKNITCLECLDSLPLYATYPSKKNSKNFGGGHLIFWFFSAGFDLFFLAFSGGARGYLQALLSLFQKFCKKEGVKTFPFIPPSTKKKTNKTQEEKKFK